MRFRNGNIFVNGRFVPGGFSVENGRFTHVLKETAEGEGTDLCGAYVIPGLVDIHTHGNSGADFSDGDDDGLVKMAGYLAHCGVTSFAPASMTLPYAVLETAFRTAVRLHKAAPAGCARLMGIRMEGPFFSEKKKGAQNAAYLRLPDYDAFARLYDAAEGLLRIADVAPELPGAVEFARRAAERCTVSVAHTDAGYEEAAAVFDAGAAHLTHLFNAMPGIRHRHPRPRDRAAGRDRHHRRRPVCGFRGVRRGSHPAGRLSGRLPSITSIRPGTGKSPRRALPCPPPPVTGSTPRAYNEIAICNFHKGGDGYELSHRSLPGEQLLSTGRMRVICDHPRPCGTYGAGGSAGRTGCPG